MNKFLTNLLKMMLQTQLPPELVPFDIPIVSKKLGHH